MRVVAPTPSHSCCSSSAAALGSCLAVAEEVPGPQAAGDASTEALSS